MNTKLKNVQINPEYADLFSYKTSEDKIEHSAQMISYRILSEVEKLCDEKSIKKKDLAEMVGTSRSYITQLFRGNKQVNTDIMAKFEEALNITFNIKVKLNEDSQEDFLSKQLPFGFFTGKRLPANGCVMYCYHGGAQKYKTGEVINSMKTEDKPLQKAV